MGAAPKPADPLPHGARVLIVRLSALGDVLFALETVAALKAERPDVEIDFLVEDRFAPILHGHPQLATVRTVPRRHRRAYLAAVRSLRKECYDVVLDLHGLAKSAVLVAASHARTKLGFAPPASREGSHRACHRAIVLPRPLPHRADRGLFLLQELGLRGTHVPAELPRPATPPGFWDGVPRPRVVLHPGTSAFAAFKRWPVARHAELARRLLDADQQVAVSYGPDENDLAAAILDAAPGCRAIDGASLGLVGLGEVYRDADVVVAADTGPLHVAAAAGTRVVALFGPKDPRLYGPRGDQGHAILFHDVPCRPCRRRRCASPQCILGIDIDRVERAIHEVLAG